MIAYIEEGQIQLSSIYLPAFHELYSADMKGAYKNGQLIHVSDVSKLSSSLIQIPNYSTEKLLPDVPFQSFLTEIGTCVDFYSVAYPVTSCASGKIE
jgi:fructose-1,6-bisphosphatase/inositol monophosphatase family enzyme